jgi:hypothetical protein
MDDPGEKADAARKIPETASKLRKALGDWRKQVDAQMPVRK